MQQLALNEFVDGWADAFLWNVECVQPLNELNFQQEGMPFVCGFAEGVKHGACGSARVIARIALGHANGIGGAKAHPADFAGDAIGVATYDVYGVLGVALTDAAADGRSKA